MKAGAKLIDGGTVSLSDDGSAGERSKSPNVHMKSPHSGSMTKPDLNLKPADYMKSEFSQISSGAISIPVKNKNRMKRDFDTEFIKKA